MAGLVKLNRRDRSGIERPVWAEVAMLLRRMAACDFAGCCYRSDVMNGLMHTLVVRACALLMIVALATTGFAHRVQSPAEQSAQAFVAALGLDASDICGDVDGDGVQGDCEACRLHASMSLPEPAVSLILAELSLAPADWTPAPPVLNALTAKGTHPARAPPVA
ncbi:MAG: polyketide synthase [Marivita sp.]|nr:polyketide synthase [Marivita sp.]